MFFLKYVVGGTLVVILYCSSRRYIIIIILIYIILLFLLFMLRAQNKPFVKNNSYPYLILYSIYNHPMSNDLSAIFNDDNFFVSGEYNIGDKLPPPG